GGVAVDEGDDVGDALFDVLHRHRMNRRQIVQIGREVDHVQAGAALDGHRRRFLRAVDVPDGGGVQTAVEFQAGQVRVHDRDGDRVLDVHSIHSRARELVDLEIQGTLVVEVECILVLAVAIEGQFALDAVEVLGRGGDVEGVAAGVHGDRSGRTRRRAFHVVN